MFKVKILSAPEDLRDAFWVREQVFTKEQGFADPDTDSWEEKALHAVIYQEGRPVAAGRVYREDDESYRVGRICVLKEFRGYHLGRMLMDELEARALALGAKRLILGAQLYAVPFYEKCGFRSTGERYMDEFCEHETLVKELAD